MRISCRPKLWKPNVSPSGWHLITDQNKMRSGLPGTALEPSLKSLLSKTAGQGMTWYLRIMQSIVKQNTYPNLHWPHTKYLHRCKSSQPSHLRFWQRRRPVFAITKVSALKSHELSSSPWSMENFDSSESTRNKTSFATVILCLRLWSISLNVRHPLFAHSIFVMVKDTRSVILQSSDTEVGYSKS